MTKKTSKAATVFHFPKTSDCKPLTDAQLRALTAISYPHSPREEHLIGSVLRRTGATYRTMEILVERRLAKFRVRNLGTEQFVYVRITEFGNQVARLDAAHRKQNAIVGHVRNQVGQAITSLRRTLDTLPGGKK